MDDIIHVYLPALWEEAQHLYRQAWEISLLEDEVRRALALLGTAWQGESAEEFLRRGYQTRNRLTGLAEELERLARLLQNTADEWALLDQAWARHWANLKITS